MSERPKIERRAGGYFVCFVNGGWSGPWRTERAAEFARDHDYASARAEEARYRFHRKHVS